MLCAEVQPVVKTNESRSFACPHDTLGSVVKLQLTKSTNANRAPTLCEVEVYGGKIRKHN